MNKKAGTAPDPIIASLGKKIAVDDIITLGVVLRRMYLSTKVVARKLELGHPQIYNREREVERLKRARKWAEAHGMDPNFAQALLYLIIDESCKEQMKQLQAHGGKMVLWPKSKPEERHAELRPRLLELTRLVVKTYERSYASAYFATRAHHAFEMEHIRRLVNAASETACLLDLGCATGRIARSFSSKFEQVAGYDVSEDMTKAAAEHAAADGLKNIDFRVADLEHGIPAQDASASLAVMNLGTASDLLDIAGFLRELYRVLKPGGKFFLSFYNRDALLYKWSFMPLDVGLAAAVDVERNCLDVHVGKQLFSVFAQAYSADEAKVLITASGLAPDEILTYPTISSILPTALLDGKEQKDVRAAVSTLDLQLAGGTHGAYLSVIGSKQ